MSGKLVAIMGINPGSTYVLNGETNTVVDLLQYPSSAYISSFPGYGSSVSISGSTVFVGDSTADVLGQASAGTVYIFNNV